MKRIVSCCFLVMIAFTAVAQLEQDNFVLQAGYKYIAYNGPHEIHSAGLDMQLFLTDYLSINSQLLLAPGYAHIPLTFIVLLSGEDAAACLSNGGSEDYCIALFLLCLTEGVSLHLQPDDRISVSPYINPLGLDYIYQDYWADRSFNDANFYLTGGAGLRLNAQYGVFVVSPYLEYRTIYNGFHGGFAVGASAGINFGAL